MQKVARYLREKKPKSERRKVKSDTMGDTQKKNIAIYAKMGTFITLGKEDAKSSLKGHKSHLGQTTMAAERAVKAVEDIPCIATIRNLERCTKAYYAMKLAYEHQMMIAPEEADKWEQEMKEIHEIKEQLKETWLPLVFLDSDSHPPLCT